MAIEKFINKEIGFMDISKTIITAFNKFDTIPRDIDDVFSIDKDVRDYVRKMN